MRLFHPYAAVQYDAAAAQAFVCPREPDFFPEAHHRTQRRRTRKYAIAKRDRQAKLLHPHTEREARDGWGAVGISAALSGTLPSCRQVAASIVWIGTTRA